MRAYAPSVSTSQTYHFMTTLFRCFTISFLFLLALPLAAQRKKAAPKPAQPALSSEQLIQLYRFEDAARQLRREIEAARKENKPTDRLEADLSRALMGSDMLRGIEEVLFIDSFKVTRSHITEQIPLSAESGHFVSFANRQYASSAFPAQIAPIAFENDLGDRLYFAGANQPGDPFTLRSAWKTKQGWGQSEELPGLATPECSTFAPFVMPDGVTLYFAQQGEGSLGGYDIFVTRYDAETQQYLKPENLGMPFNSPANEYLLAIDETSQLGWLVTDRNQQGDTVCVYVFVPSQTRDVYEYEAYERSELISFAKLSSVAATQTNRQAVAQAQERLKAQRGRREVRSKEQHRWVISDDKVYTELAQFRSEAARRIAAQLEEEEKTLGQMAERADQLEWKLSQGDRSDRYVEELRSLREKLPQQQALCNELAKNMRKAELGI